MVFTARQLLTMPTAFRLVTPSSPAPLRSITEATEALRSLNPTFSAFSVSVLPLLHDSDLVLRQPVQLIHQRVDLRVGGLDVALRCDDGLRGGLAFQGLLHGQELVPDLSTEVHQNRAGDKVVHVRLAA